MYFSFQVPATDSLKRPARSAIASNLVPASTVQRNPLYENCRIAAVLGSPPPEPLSSARAVVLLSKLTSHRERALR